MVPSAGGGSGPANSKLIYREPYNIAIGSGTVISYTGKVPAAPETVTSNLSSTDYVSKIVLFGARLVALLTDGTLKYSGTKSETSTLVLDGQVVKA